MMRGFWPEDWPVQGSESDITPRRWLCHRVMIYVNGFWRACTMRHSSAQCRRVNKRKTEGRHPKHEPKPHRPSSELLPLSAPFICCPKILRAVDRRCAAKREIRRLRNIV